MELEFLIENKEHDPKLGIIEGYIQEGINQVSLIELKVVSDVDFSEKECEALLGKKVTLKLGDAVGGELLWSRFDGIIFEFQVPDSKEVPDGWFAYTLVIRPDLWKLNFDTRSKSFVQKNRIEVIDEVLSGTHKFIKDLDFKTLYQNEQAYVQLSQILQSETTDLRFLQTLMQEAGINYYFSAQKDGEEKESLKLVDNNAYFENAYKNDIPWLSQVGRTGGEAERHIDFFDTRFHTTPASVNATVNLWDGFAKHFEASKEVGNWTDTTCSVFGREGQEQVAKQSATVLSQCFESNRVTYQGQSNQFLIRAGEKISVKGSPVRKDTEVLVTSVEHRFHQTVQTAMGNAPDPAYRNNFSAVRKNAEYRPAPVRHDPMVGALTAQKETSSDRFISKLSQKIKDALNVNLDFEEPLPLGSQKTIIALIDQLERARDLFGVMVGEVIEDAKVTEGKELTCKIKNERYPDGLTAKIALGWLTEQGWQSLLPRKGMQVYFMLVQGEGGQNEAVLIGYRPTAKIPTLDPAETTETKKLKVGTAPEIGSAAEAVVEPETYSPINRQRNTLLGEGAVAEVAVIDGGEDAVSIHANRGVHIVGEEEIHLDGASQCQRAETLDQQFGSVNRGVTGDQKESVGGNHEMTVMGDQEVQVKGNMDLNTPEDKNVTIAAGDDTVMALQENNIAAIYSGKGKNELLIVQDKGQITMKSESTTVIEAKDSITASVDGAMVVELTKDDNTVSITQGDGHVTTLNSSGITIEAGGNSIKMDKMANKVEITGGMEVSISGAVQVNIKGGMINLN